MEPHGEGGRADHLERVIGQEDQAARQMVFQTESLPFMIMYRYGRPQR